MARYGIRDIVDVTIKDFATGKPVLYLSSLKSSELSTAVATAYAKGGHGSPKIIAWDGEREEKYKFTDALITPEGLGLLFGSTPSIGAVTARHTEALVVSGNSITLSKTPLGTVGLNKWLFLSPDGASLGTELTYAATPATPTASEYGTITTNSIKVTQADGTIIIASYDYTSAATTKTITIDSTKFPKTVEIIGETFFRNESGVDVPAQLKIFKGKLIFNGTITMNADGDPSTFDFEVECLKAVGKTNMVDLYIFE